MSFRRMMQATKRLLEEGTFESATVQEIVRLSNSSVGAFYARFGSKEAVYRAVQKELLDTMVATYSRRIERLRGTEATLEDRYRAIAVTAVELYRHEAGALRSLSLLARLRHDMGLHEAPRRANAEMAELFLGLLLECRQEITHQDPEGAIRFALSLTSAALREFVLYGESQLAFTQISDDELITETCRVAMAYLKNGSSRA